jgi:hypothetical protein
MLRFVVLEITLLTAKVRDTIESQPFTLVRLAVCAPGPLKIRPFHTNGIWFEQTVWFILTVKLGFTTTVIVDVDAHCPTFGVKVYVVVEELFTTGDHVPVMPFKDVVGIENVSPLQIGAT